jgi:MFS family permease
MQLQPADRHRQHVVLASLTVGCTAYALVQVAVAPALSTFTTELDTSTIWATWIVTSFLLSASVATPIIGRLGDQYGKRRMLLVSLALFIAGCAGAAAAWNVWTLIVFRAVQGTAGAVFPLGYSVIRDEFPVERVGPGIAVLSAMYGIGASLGLVGAGVIVDNLSWRWLFIAPAIAAVAGLALIAAFIRPSPVRATKSLDVSGAILFGAGLCMLLLGLSQAESWGWGSAAVLGLFAAAGVLLAAWLRIERRAEAPMIDLELFSRRPLLLTNTAALLVGVAMFAWFVLVPLFAESGKGSGSARVAHYGFGLTATQAGLLMIPATLATLVSGVAAGSLGARIGMKWTLVVGSVVFGCAVASLAAWHGSVREVAIAQVFVGGGLGLALAALPALVTTYVPQDETGVANGMNFVIRSTGLVIGAQIGALFLSAFTVGHTSVPSVRGYTLTFGVAALCALGAAGLAVMLPRASAFQADQVPTLLADPDARAT